MNRLVQITALLLLAAGVAVGAEVKSATLLLQEGIYAEETEGNLDKAIGIYQEAAKAAGESEKAAAEAVFRTGMCYLKKGDKATAAAQFGIVVTKYASQKAITEQANKQLSMLGMGQQEPELPEDVRNYIVAQQIRNCVEADKKGIAANGQVYGVDADLNCYRGGMIVFKNATGKTISNEINLGGTSYGNKTGVDEKLRAVRSNSASGPEYQLYWTPNPPVGPNDTRIIGWRIPGSTKLIVGTDGKATLGMQNFYGPEVIESFFLIVEKGTELDFKGDEPTARATFSDSDVYEWTKHVQKSTNHKLTVMVAAGNSEAAKPMEIGPVPWTDGEICKLSLKTNSGMPIGGLYYMPRLIKDGGRDVWQLDSYQFVTVQESRQFTRVEADAETFAPIAGRTINQMGDFVAAYDKDKVALATTMKGKMSTKEIAVSGPVFDNEQAIMLIRRLPLAEGYSTRFQIFTVQGGAVIDCPIEVIGKEEVTVPFGTGPCWKVKLAIYSGQIKALEHTLYFSADEHKRLMKYDAGSAVMELLEVSMAQPQMVVSESDSGVSFTLPTGWIAHIEAQNGGYKPYAQIANEGLETWACLSGQSAVGQALNATVDGDITTLKGFFKDYAPRAGSRTTITVDGVPAVYYAADYVDDEKSMVEHRTYLIKNGTVYWFVFRIEKDKFEANKAIYDGIVSSFAVADK